MFTIRNAGGVALFLFGRDGLRAEACGALTRHALVAGAIIFRALAFLRLFLFLIGHALLLSISNSVSNREELAGLPT